MHRRPTRGAALRSASTRAVQTFDDLSSRVFRIGDDIEIGTVRGQVQYEVHRALLERFRKRDIELAYAVREIRMRSAKA